MASAINAKCPLCKNDIDFGNLKSWKSRIDRKFQEYLKDRYSVEFSVREAKLAKSGAMLGDSVEIVFQVGNHYEPIKNTYSDVSGKYTMEHKWFTFVRLKDPK